MKKSFIAIICMSMILVLFSGCNNKTEQKYKIGSTITATGKLTMCPTKEEEQRLAKYLNANDEDGVKKMAYDEEYFCAAKGDKILIEDYSGTDADVKITEGDDSGKEGYINIEDLNKNTK